MLCGTKAGRLAWAKAFWECSWHFLGVRRLVTYHVEVVAPRNTRDLEGPAGGVLADDGGALQGPGTAADGPRRKLGGHGCVL